MITLIGLLLCAAGANVLRYVHQVGGFLWLVWGLLLLGVGSYITLYSFSLESGGRAFG